MYEVVTPCTPRDGEEGAPYEPPSVVLAECVLGQIACRVDAALECRADVLQSVTSTLAHVRHSHTAVAGLHAARTAAQETTLRRDDRIVALEAENVALATELQTTARELQHQRDVSITLAKELDEMRAGRALADVVNAVELDRLKHELARQRSAS